MSTTYQKIVEIADQMNIISNEKLKTQVNFSK